MTEILKPKKAVSPTEKCWVESGRHAILVLRYDDPENPKLEAMDCVNDTISLKSDTCMTYMNSITS